MPVTIRLARATDIPDLNARDLALIGTRYPWGDRLGDGTGDHEALALVAVDATDQSIAHAGVTIAKMENIQARPGQDIRPTPWWKLNSLAVDLDHQGNGVARTLLAQMLERMPRHRLGIYGNVDESKQQEILWYRRQGFTINPVADLTLGAGQRRHNVHFPGDTELAFQAERHVLAGHLDGRSRADEESRIAERVFQRVVMLQRKSQRPRTDVGYRTFAHALAEKTHSTCEHTRYGPRPLFLMAWDPDLVQRCETCNLQQLSSLPSERDDLCNGCHRVDASTLLSQGTVDSRLLTVAAGLCQTCRGKAW